MPELALSEHIFQRGEPRELKHLSTWRKGKQSDSLSSGERTGTSPNRDLSRGCGQTSGVTKVLHKRSGLESPAVEGDSPVFEMQTLRYVV